jgi:hypothetical protein
MSVKSAHIWSLFLFGIAIAFSSSQAIAQKAIIKGQVFDEDKNRLPGANVIIPDLQIGTTTDDEGRFELQLEPQSISMTISFIGYNSTSLRISKQELLKKGEYKVKVELVPFTQDIGTATVIGEKRTAFIEEARESVLDFEFLGDDLVVLISDKRGYRIQRYDEEMNRIGSMFLEDKPEGFFKDCFGGVHLRYRYHVDELEVMGKSLGVRISYGVREFREILSPCIVSTDSDIYFRTTEMSNQRITYFAKNIETKKSRILHVVEEVDKLAMIKGTREHIADLRKRLATESFATPSDRAEIERDIQQYEWFDQVILSKMSYHPLYLYSDTLYVFDHFQNGMFVYDREGNFIRDVAFDYHLNKDWAELVLMDEVNGRFYVDIAGRGISVLHLFDPQSGEYEAKLVIDDHTFPEKMKIRKNRVWYIHQDLNQDAPGLYVMDIPIEEE